MSPIDILYFILLLGPLIFFHEFGHYIVARACKVTVLEFSIGFGPTITAIQRGETVWRIAWLPLGGYVKMLGADPMEEVPQEAEEGSFASKPLWQRTAIVAAGPVFNLILPLFVFFAVFVAQDQVNPAQVGTLQPDGVAYEAGIREGDIIKSIDGEAVEGWWELTELIGSSPGEEISIVVERNGVELPAKKVTPHTATETVAPELGLTRVVGRIQIEIAFRKPIVYVHQGTAAWESGLRPWDRILSLGGVKAERWDRVEFELKAAQGPVELVVLREKPLTGVRDGLDAFVFSTVDAPKTITYDPSKGNGTLGLDSAEFYLRDVTPGSPEAVAGLLRGDKITALNGRRMSSWGFFKGLVRAEPDREIELAFERGGVAQEPVKLTFERRNQKGEFNTDVTLTIFGIGNHSAYGLPDPVPNTKRMSFATFQAWSQTKEIFWLTAKSLTGLFTGKVGMEQMGGPIFIFEVAAKAGEEGWYYFFRVLCWLSISLGLINLVPIPLLDGGHLLFFAIEGIKRSPVSLRTRQIAAYIGFSMIILLMLVVMRNDIGRAFFG